LAVEAEKKLRETVIQREEGNEPLLMTQTNESTLANFNKNWTTKVVISMSSFSGI
jgi:hypothetical protein